MDYDVFSLLYNEIKFRCYRYKICGDNPMIEVMIGYSIDKCPVIRIMCFIEKVDIRKVSGLIIITPFQDDILAYADNRTGKVSGRSNF